MNAQKTLTPALGWFSMALGAAQIAAPKQVSRAIGTDGHSTLMRSIGMREIGSGVAVLSRRKPARGLWARVAGDAMDIGLLLAGMKNERNDRTRMSVALASVVAITAADMYAALSPSTQPKNGTRKADFTKSVSMMIAPDALFELMRDPETFALVPGFEDAILTLEASEPRALVWRVRGGRFFNGTMVITITEHTTPERGSAMRIDAYSEAGGIAGILRRAIAEIPGDEMAIGLRRLKNIVEVGYVIKSDSPSGRQNVGLPR